MSRNYLVGVDVLAALLPRRVRTDGYTILGLSQTDQDATNAAAFASGAAGMSKGIESIRLLLAKATSLDQLRKDFEDAVATSARTSPAVRPGDIINEAGRNAMEKAVASFRSLLANATSLDQLRKDFEDAVATAQGRSSGLSAAAVVGIGAGVVGGVGLLVWILRLVVGRRR